MELELLYYKKMSSSLRLKSEQNKAYSLMTQGKNIFLTGAGGTGKSETIKLFVKIYNSSKNISVTSTTGTSALLINGVTLHSYLGIGLGTGSVISMSTKILKKFYLKNRWTKLDVLIIDEISMMSPELFDKLEEMARIIRRSSKPFGGIQLVLSGDFCFSGNTKILMSNGNIKFAKDINIGDELMGDDNNSRKVLRLFQGVAKMYKIDMPRGESFTVTGNHILCLRMCRYKHILWNEIKQLWIAHYWDNDIKNKSFSIHEYEAAKLFLTSFQDELIIELSVNDYLKLPYKTQCELYCYKVEILHWPNREETELLINPWLLGAWLGFNECISEFIIFLEQMDCCINSLENALGTYNLINNKHIPDVYMYASKEIRLELLAGLIDTDGCMSTTNNTYQIRHNLAEQICFLSRSLGLSCYIYEQYCNIGGNIDEIPCRITYKKATKINKNPLLMKIKITPVEEDNFYGFETDGNRRFLLGDFTVTHNCQLPCIDSSDFCCHANSWKGCIDDVVYLTEIIRQRDPIFQNCLNHVRLGELPNDVLEILESRVGVEIVNEFGIRPTRLYPLNRNVDYVNEEELDKLATEDTEFFEYNMEIKVYDCVNDKQATLDKFKKYCTAQETLQLCIGAQVMLLYNLDLEDKLANGSRGVVVGFTNELPIVKFLNGVERVIDYHTWEIEEMDVTTMKMTQVPLKLAYAVSIHKIQGCSLDCVEVDLTNVFEYGQAYTALSRVKNLEGLSIIGYNINRIKAHPKAIEFYKNI